MHTLRRGDRGPDVARLQSALNQRLEPTPMLLVDGDFGEKTEKALLRFQLFNHLPVDGRAGPDSLRALGMSELTAVDSGPGHSAPAPWLDIARAELGVSELVAPGADNPRIVEYHSTTSLHASDDETPWCSSFVNWALIRAGYQGTRSARARDWLRWGRDLSEPEVGAVTVLHRKHAGRHDASTGSSSGFHVAFFISRTPTQIRLLGGNQSNQVKYSNFFLSGYEVSGYRWPATPTSR